MSRINLKPLKLFDCNNNIVYLFFRLMWILIVNNLASLLPLADDETDKRTSHNIMRFGRQAGHNILRFGRTPGHNIMRFGKREESNSAPGSSFEMISDSKPISFLNDYQRSGYNHYGLFDPPSSSSSSLIPFNILINDNNNNNNNINDNNIDNLNSNNNGFDINTSYLPIGYYGQPSPLNPLYVLTIIFKSINWTVNCLSRVQFDSQFNLVYIHLFPLFYLYHHHYHHHQEILPNGHYLTNKLKKDDLKLIM